MGRLYATIGLPRSGKTTLCKKWVNREVEIVFEENLGINIFDECSLLFANLDNRVVIHDDDFRLALGDRYNYYIEPFIDAMLQTTIRAFLMQDCEVLYDSTNTSIKSIEKLLRIDPNTKFVFVDTEPGLCKMRAWETDQKDLIPVIDRMVNNFNNLVDLTGNLSDSIKHIKSYILKEKEDFERIV